jgi:hypothetical protein
VAPVMCRMDLSESINGVPIMYCSGLVFSSTGELIPAEI